MYELQLTTDINESLDQIDKAFQSGQGREMIHFLLTAKKITGIGLAKALWLENKSWNNADETFRDFAVQEYGLHTSTVKRYVEVWEAVRKAPENLQKFLVQKDMQSLQPIGTYFAEETEKLEEEDWQLLVEAEDQNATYDAIHEIRGTERKRKNQIVIYMDGEGNLYTYQDEERFFIGYLDIRARDVEPVDKAINRIINNVHIKEK
jgi:hypothetical protein